MPSASARSGSNESLRNCFRKMKCTAPMSRKIPNVPSTSFGDTSSTSPMSVRRNSSLPSALLLLSRSAEGNEELRRTLIGDVLLVSPKEVLGTFGIFLLIGAVHFIFRKQFLKLSFEPERAEAEGMAVRWWDFLFYALFGLVVTTFLQIGGVLLVFSYLIVPAVCANFLVGRLAALLFIGWLVATLASVIGLYVAFKSDLPTGATIVCTLGAALVLTAIVARFRK